MARNSSVNLDISNLSVGFSIGGGATKRTLTVNGAGNTTLTSQQNIVLTLPNRASDTIVGYGDYSAKGVILVGTGSGTFTALSVGTNNFVLTADSAQSSGVKWAAVTDPAQPGGVTSWVSATGAIQATLPNTGYIANSGSQVGFTLPTTAAQGTVIRIAGFGAGSWVIGQAAGQSIKVGNVSTTTGASGGIIATNQYDQIELLCVVANTTWVALSGWGNLNVL